MINLNKLLESERVVVTYANTDIDSTFVKNFRQKYNLTQVALANILGVTKKAVEKWEQGTNKINKSTVVLLSLLYEDEQLLKKLYNVQVKSAGDKSDICYSYDIAGEETQIEQHELINSSCAISPNKGKHNNQEFAFC